MAKRLAVAVEASNTTQVYAILATVLNKDAFSTEAFREFVHASGGEETLINELKFYLRFYGDEREERLTRIRRSIPIQIRRRLNNDEPLPGEYDVYKLEREIDRAHQNVDTVEFLARIASGLIIFQPVKEWLDDVLGTAKRYWSKTALELADSGYPITATFLQTFVDIAIPGSALELGINAIPVGRGGGIAAVAYKKASKEVFDRLIAKGISRQSDKATQLAKEIDVVMEGLLRDQTPEVRQLVLRGAEGDRAALLELAVWEKMVNEVVPLYQTVAVNQSRLVLRNAAKRLMPDLENFLQIPKGSVAKGAIKELPDGRVIQTIETKFIPREGIRLSNAKATAEACWFEFR